MEVASPPADVKRMAGPAAFTLAAQAFRVAATMVLTILVSRILGAEALGSLTLGLTLATSATIVASLGVDQGVIYFVARARASAVPGPGPMSETGDTTPSPIAVGGARQQPPTSLPSAAAATRTALIIAAAGGLTLGLLAWAAAPAVAQRWFQAPDLRGILVILAPTIPLGAVFAAALGAIQGSFRVIHRAIVEWIMFPLLTLSIAFAALWMGKGVDGVAGSYLLAWIVVTAVAATIALRIPGKRTPLAFRPLMAFSLPLMLSLLTGYMLFHVDVLMLGGLAGVREVGLYSVAIRLSLPLFLVLDSVARVFAPMVAHLYAPGYGDRLGTVYAVATEWILAINAPVGILLAVNAPAILGLFGDEFVASAGALRVLCLGIVMATACGAAASVLTMTRWQKLEMGDNLLLLLINVFLNYLLVPRFGALGAAIATATSATSVYALKVVQAWWLLSVQPFRWAQLASVTLALAAAGMSRLSSLLFEIPAPAELAVVVVVYATTYGVLWWRWGCSATSRDVLGTMLRRDGLGETLQDGRARRSLAARDRGLNE